MIDGIELTSFGLTHLLRCHWYFIKSDQGHIVIAEQFVVDFDMQDNAYECDIALLLISEKKCFMLSDRIFIC